MTSANFRVALFWIRQTARIRQLPSFHHKTLSANVYLTFFMVFREADRIYNPLFLRIIRF